MTRIVAPALLLRLGLGVAAVLLTGFAAFRLSVFDPREPAFHCLTVGTLLAALLALLRSGRVRTAVGVATVFALLRLGFVHSQGWAAPVAGVCLVFGVLVLGILFDALARYGIRVGKFLVLGPLLAGLYVALTPLAEMGRLVGSDLHVTLLRWAFLGVLIGDSTGLGVEFADLLVTARRPDGEVAIEEPST